MPIPLHRGGIGSDHLVHSCYFWVRTSEGYPMCPWLPRGLDTRMMFMHKKWQDPETVWRSMKLDRRGSKGWRQFLQRNLPLYLRMFLHIQVHYFPSIQLNHCLAEKNQGIRRFL